MKLRVVVRVDVDEPRRDQEAVGIDFTITALAECSDLDHPSVMDRDIGGVPRRAGAVDDRPAADDEIDAAHA